MQFKQEIENLAMQPCRHCGKENEDSVALCSECGLELGKSPLHRTAIQVAEHSKNFFRWKPASICLIVFAAIYVAIAILCVWLGFQLSSRGEQTNAHIAFRNVFWFALGAILCFAGRQLMSRQTEKGLLAGALTVAIVLFFALRGWIWELSHFKNISPAGAAWLAFEAVLTWTPLLYAIIYAFRESKNARRLS